VYLESLIRSKTLEGSGSKPAASLSIFLGWLQELEFAGRVQGILDELNPSAAVRRYLLE
jgi:hypothetical protein